MTKQIEKIPGTETDTKDFVMSSLQDPRMCNP